MVGLVYGRISIWVSPSEVAACAKLRFGHVSPGTEQNQRVHTPNSDASRPSTGTFSGRWQAIASGPRPVTGVLGCDSQPRTQFASDPSSPPKAGGATPPAPPP